MKKLSIILALGLLVFCGPLSASMQSGFFAEGGSPGLSSSLSTNMPAAPSCERDEDDPKNTFLVNYGTIAVLTYAYIGFERTILSAERSDFIARAGVGFGFYNDFFGPKGKGMAYVGDLGIIHGREKLRYGGHVGVRAYIDSASSLDNIILPSLLLEVRFHLEEGILIKIGTGLPELVNLGIGFRF